MHRPPEGAGSWIGRILRRARDWLRRYIEPWLTAYLLRWRDLCRTLGGAFFPIACIAAVDAAALYTSQGEELVHILRHDARWWQALAFVLANVYFGMTCGLAAQLSLPAVSKASALSARGQFRLSLRNAVLWMAALAAILPVQLALWVGLDWGRGFLRALGVLFLLGFIFFHHVPPAAVGRSALAWMDQFQRGEGRFAKLVGMVVILALALGMQNLVGDVIQALVSLLVGLAALSLLFGEDGWAMQAMSSGSQFFLKRPGKAVLAILGLGLVAGVALSFPGHPEGARLLGAAGVLMLGLGFWQMVFTLAVPVLSRHSRFAVLLLLASVLAFHGLSRPTDPHVVAARVGRHAGPPVGQAEPQPSLEQRFLDWMAARHPPPDTPYRIYLVATEGGGIRAAYWTAAVLSRLHQASNGEFTHRLFAISGVSGGSVGATSFLALLADAARDTPLQDLRADTPCAHPLILSEDRLEQWLGVLADDHLAPLVAGWAFPDVLNQLLPAGWLPDRADTFEGSLVRSWEARMGTRTLAGGWRAMWQAEGGCARLPSLILNATTVSDGKRVLVSNLGLDLSAFRDVHALTRPFDIKNGADGQVYQVVEELPAVSAAHLSARFPYVSPAGTVPVVPDSSLPYWARVVDGGYFENSGAATLLEAIREIEAVALRHACTARSAGRFCLPPIEVHAVLIENDPEVVEGATGYVAPTAPMQPDGGLDACAQPQFQAQAASAPVPRRAATLLDGLGAPLETFWHTRNARGTLAKAELLAHQSITLFPALSDCSPSVPVDPVAGETPQVGVCRQEARARLSRLSLGHQLCDSLRRSPPMAPGAAGSEAQAPGQAAVRSVFKPPLGWTLSHRSTQIMRELACGLALDQTLQGPAPWSQAAVCRGAVGDAGR